MATGLDAYLIFFVLINIVIIQLSYSLETMHSKSVFGLVALFITCRMIFDMYMPVNSALYLTFFGFGILVELFLLRYIVRKMNKYTSSPPVILLFTAVTIIVMDTRHFCHKMILDAIPEAAMHTPMQPLEQ